MANLVDTIIEIITSNQADSMPGALLQTAELFEKYKGYGKRLTPEDQMIQYGWSLDVINTTITDEDVLQLRGALVQFIKRHSTGHYIGSALYALGKLRDLGNKAVFIEAMEKLIDTDQTELLFQAMMALHDIGEDVFLGQTSLWARDENNQELARLYLRRHRNRTR